MMRNMVIIAREAIYMVMEALDMAIGMAINLGWDIDQVRFEDAYQLLRDALFLTMPRGDQGRTQ